MGRLIWNRTMSIVKTESLNQFGADFMGRSIEKTLDLGSSCLILSSLDCTIWSWVSRVSLKKKN